MAGNGGAFPAEWPVIHSASFPLAIPRPFHLKREWPMKWYRPNQAAKEIENRSRMLATIAVIAITLSLVAIIFAIGDTNAT
jgi:hypothetical protein